jgi:hypothetical protein
VTHMDLDELVRQARRDRPAPSLLSSVARTLRVPFVAAPLAALVVPSTATAATTAATLLKAGLGRITLLGWGAGSAVAASGVAAAVYLSQPAPVPVVPTPAKAVPQSVAPVAKAVEPEPEPEAPAAPANAEKRSVKDAVATWDEPQLIERARRALGSDPRRALQLAQEHRRRFPSGALSVEREVILLDALARSGQSAEALRRARAFETRYPKSIHTPRVRALRAKLEGS